MWGISHCLRVGLNNKWVFTWKDTLELIPKGLLRGEI